MISVDTKKKELVGNFSNAGREWQPKATPPAVRVHDFPSDAEGKAIPYGVYDMARNEAWVSVGCQHAKGGVGQRQHPFGMQVAFIQGGDEVQEVVSPERLPG